MDYKTNAFPIVKGQINLTSGTHQATGALNELVMYCVADGDLTVAWQDNTTDTLSCVVGNAFKLYCKSVTIASGTFHKA